jgi:hypothetical protein
MYPGCRYMALTILIYSLLATNCIRKVKSSLTSSRSVNTPPVVVIANDTLLNPCDIAGPVVSQAKEWEGVVTYRGHPEYHGNTGLYCIIHSEPTDSFWFGYVCNQMPDQFKRNGLRVIFSGKYYHAYKDIPPTGRDSQRLLYLRLETIRML